MRDWVVGGAVIESALLGAGAGGSGVLLVENRRRGGETDWTTPGGVIDPGEEVLDGLTREVREETGLEVLRWGGMLYEIVAEAPGLGWRLRVEVHRAAAVAGELSVGDDPDGIVIGAEWADDVRCVEYLGGSHQWVREPLLEWLDERFAEPRSFRYRIEGERLSELLCVRT
ncbi:MAG TPA: NUDIX hydrolase [Microthrixaceae bacterium]|nr:NUDIX hydrolase [Microthrixaceae bacterium]